MPIPPVGWNGTFPITISQPGSYFFTRNLTTASTTGIWIAANNVVLDLNGFTLDGGGNGDYGIYDASQAHQNVSVAHGTVRGFRDGVWLLAITGGKISDIRVIGASDAAGYGIVAQSKGLIEDCDVTNILKGVSLPLQSVMRRCHIHDIGQEGVNAAGYTVVEDSVIELAGVGIYTNQNYVTVRNNRFAKNGDGSQDVIVLNGVATVIGNVLGCEGSAYANGGLIVTSGPGGSHPNIPVYAAGFCTGH